jgi:hypothetical protein
MFKKLRKFIFGKAQIRSRVQWVEQGEKNTKYFLGLEKTRQTRKTINSLYDENGGITRQHSVFEYITGTSNIFISIDIIFETCC